MFEFEWIWPRNWTLSTLKLSQSDLRDQNYSLEPQKIIFSILSRPVRSRTCMSDAIVLRRNTVRALNQLKQANIFAAGDNSTKKRRREKVRRILHAPNRSSSFSNVYSYCHLVSTRGLFESSLSRSLTRKNSLGTAFSLLRARTQSLLMATTTFRSTLSRWVGCWCREVVSSFAS